MNKLIALLFLLLPFTIAAQDAIVKKLQQESSRNINKAIPDTAKIKWTAGGSLAANIGQGSQHNWAAGGDDFSFTLNTAINGFVLYKHKNHTWDNNLDINFGYINTTSLGGRKNDDRFDVLSKYGYKIDKKLHLTTLANFRSQFLKGYTYPDNVKTFASKFLAPAYLVLSQGMDYKPVQSFSVFLSPITSRWVFVTDSVLSAKGEFGVDKGSKSISQYGAFATMSFQQSINKVLAYKARLDLFSNYKKEAANVDVFMTNSFTAKLAKVLAISWNVDLIYDDDIQLFGKEKSSPGLQLKSVVGIGLQVKI